MTKHVSPALAAALVLTAPIDVARADGTSAFGAANAAQLRGYSASPAQISVPAGGPGARPAAAVTAPQRPKAPPRGR
ncbi:hypothetical protein ACU4GR_32185 [Methylobacterium oryzae CBMB20]